MPPFKFKQFAVNHDRSAMKVGIDGVLIACWADAKDTKEILDVGTGCGLIALIMAQRCPDAHISGIDIDEPSVEEAKENVRSSPWSGRVLIEKISFPDEFLKQCDVSRRFDLIISNPPYFKSGIDNASTPRELARHQGSLSPYTLLSYSPPLLSENGSVAFVVPTDETEALECRASELGYKLRRKCLVRGHEKAPWKRVLLQFSINTYSYGQSPEIENLTLESDPGIPTDEYRNLCKDFYLKF